MFRTFTRPAGRVAFALGGAAVLGLGLTATAPASAAQVSTAPAPAPASASASATQASAAPAAGPNGRYTAGQIHTFLEDFYGEHGPVDFARKYGISEHLKEKVAGSEGFDVLLCAQNEPRSIDIGEVRTAQSAGVGYATVTTHWGGDGGSTATFTAYVGLDATRPIQLQDTDCAPEA
ncbi:hypothetical protein [Streptomyces beigongshangae]|uniref:hypothetical protein n=1 Tax=Streptomyces beigongshangae TaxID=2841597 RepID=UPI0021A910AB|nr:hypothetical protein [Streptomyces sp. REN17]